MARHASLAEYYAAHRRAFVLAQELGCTPREAAIELIRRDSTARREDIRRRHRAEAEMATPARAASAFWWQRED